MAATTIDRTNYTALADDTGAAIPDGTNWNKNQIKIVILDQIDAMFAAAVTFGASITATTAIIATTSLSVGTTANIVGNFSVNTNKFNVTASNGNTAVAGTFAVTGNSVFTGTVSINGNFDVNTSRMTVSASSGNTQISGVFTAIGSGTHTFSAAGPNGILVQGTGTSQYAFVNSTAGTVNTTITTYAQSWSTVGIAIAGTTLISNDTGGGSGLSLAATAAGGVIRFFSGGTTERMRLHGSGGLSLGDTTDPGAGWLRVAGNQLLVGTFTGGTSTVLDVFVAADVTGGRYVTFRAASGSIVGSITELAGAASIAFNTSSDIRLKTDLGIATVPVGLKDLEVHDFTWPNGTPDRGVFAQDAYEIYPRAITMGGDDLDENGRPIHPWMVDYSKFVPDLIVGWQQHDMRVEQLEAQVAALTARVAALESA